MKIDKLTIVVSRNGRKERIKVTDIDHASPDVKALIRAASRTSTTMTLFIDAGDNDVAAVIRRLHLGSLVRKYERPKKEVEVVATSTEEAYLQKLNTRLEGYSYTDDYGDTHRLSAYVTRTLKRVGIQYIWEVAEKTETDLLKIKSFGRKSLNEINELIGYERLFLGTRFSDGTRAKLIMPE